jgi:hypothetical protein
VLWYAATTLVTALCISDRGVDDLFAHLMAHCMQLRVSDGVLQRRTRLDERSAAGHILCQYRSMVGRLHAIAKDVIDVTLDTPMVGRVKWDWRGCVHVQAICLRRSVKVCESLFYVFDSGVDILCMSRVA